MKNIFSLILSFMTVTTVQAQQTVVIQRPGVFTDLASAAGAIASFPFAVVEGVVVGTVEAAGSLVHGSTEIIVVPSATPISAPIVVAPAPVMADCAPSAIPTTTIVTTHGDGTVTTITRQTASYELGPVILPPVDPAHRVGTSPLVNPYVYRPR